MERAGPVRLRPEVLRSESRVMAESNYHALADHRLPARGVRVEVGRERPVVQAKGWRAWAGQGLAASVKDSGVQPGQGKLVVRAGDEKA
jgi:hypothetical protein